MGLVLLGVLLVVGGVLASLTGVGLVVGVPAVIAGVLLVGLGTLVGTVKLLLLPVRLVVKVLLLPVKAVLRVLRWAAP